MWNPDAIVSACAEGLAGAERELGAEQAPYGLDALHETGLHPRLETALLAAGFGVFREWPFPGDRGARPEHRDRERCDLVLTERPDASPGDPVAELKASDRAVGTLFEPLTEAIAGRVREASPRTPPDECFWLEIKTIGQYTYTEGVPGPNRTYASELTRGPMTDVRKLSKERSITHAGSLIVLFTEDEATARHDLGALMHRCLDRDLPVASPAIESLAIADRVGNARCTICLIPVRSVTCG